MTARVSMLKSQAFLTCFRGCFLLGRSKDLSAPRYFSKLCFCLWALLVVIVNEILIGNWLQHSSNRVAGSEGHNWILSISIVFPDPVTSELCRAHASLPRRCAITERQRKVLYFTYYTRLLVEAKPSVFKRISCVGNSFFFGKKLIKTNDSVVTAEKMSILKESIR